MCHETISGQQEWHSSYNNPKFSSYFHKLTSALSHAGVGSAGLNMKARAVIDAMVDRQALMLAYNDVSWIFGFLFLSVILFAFLIPGRRMLVKNLKPDSGNPGGKSGAKDSGSPAPVRG